MADVSLKIIGCVNSAKGFVNKIGEDPRNPDGTIKGSEDDEVHQKIRPTLVDGVALASVGTGIASMVLTQNYVVDAACCGTFVAGPYCAYQKHALNELGGLRGQHNELRGHVNDLAGENDKLSSSIDGLETQVDKLEGVEAALDEIVKDKKTSVDRLTYIVKRNAELQDQIKRNLRREVMSNLFKLVIQADRNQDFKLNRGEMEMLIFRMRSMNGIDFNEQAFRSHIKEMPMTLSDIMEILRNLFDEHLPAHKSIFQMNVKKLAKK